MKVGLVLEGGACRGVFTTGVLSVMQERGMRFDYCVGVSAGAGNAMNFKSGQIGRVLELTAGDDYEDYYGIAQLGRSGKLLDLDYLYHTLSYDERLPFDFDAYYRNPMQCEYVLTCCESGKAVYYSGDAAPEQLLDAVKASCSLPGICTPVALGKAHYLDGGIADPMPVKRALAHGCDKVVLVMTKPAHDLRPTDYSRLRPLLSRLYHLRYPELLDALMCRKELYFEQHEQILELERQGKIFLIRPEECGIRGLEKDHAKMRGYYRHGQEIAAKRWDELARYLAQPV